MEKYTQRCRKCGAVEEFPLGYTQISLADTSEDFRKGFKAALDFFDGADTFQIVHEDEESITVELPNTDNSSYIIEDSRVKFDSTGVEL